MPCFSSNRSTTPERWLAVHTSQPAYLRCRTSRSPCPLYAQVIEISKQEARVKRVSCADGIGDRTFSACQWYRLPSAAATAPLPPHFITHTGTIPEAPPALSWSDSCIMLHSLFHWEEDVHHLEGYPSAPNVPSLLRIGSSCPGSPFPRCLDGGDHAAPKPGHIFLECRSWQYAGAAQLAAPAILRRNRNLYSPEA